MFVGACMGFRCSLYVVGCVCVCAYGVYFCTKFQLLNEYNGILFSMYVCVYCSRVCFGCLAARANGPFGLVLFAHCYCYKDFYFSFVRVCKHIYTCFNFMFCSYVSFEAKASKSVPFSIFSTRFSLLFSFFSDSAFLFPLNFFVFNSLKVKCVYTI